MADRTRVAVITGGSKGLGRALARALGGNGWSLVLDARGAEALEAVGRELRAQGTTTVVTVPGDVADEQHRWQLVEAAEQLGGLHLLAKLGAADRTEAAVYAVREGLVGRST